MPHHSSTDYSHLNKKKFSKQGFNDVWKLFSYIKPYKFEYALGLLLLLISSLANLVAPKLLGNIVNIGNEGGLTSELNRIILILAIVLVVQAIFSYIRVVLFTRVTEKSVADIRKNTYNHILKLPLSFFDKNRVGELNSRISADISLVHEAFTSSLADLLRQLIIVLGAVTILLFDSPKLTLFMLAIVPVTMILVYFFGKFIRNLSRKAQKGVAESNVIVEETLQGIRSVKSYTNEMFEIARYAKKIKEVVKFGITNGKYRGAFHSFLGVAMMGAIIAVIWKGSIMVSAGEINVGDLVGFLFYTFLIAGNIGGMAAVITRIQRFVGATEDLFEILENDTEEISDDIHIDSAYELKGEIKIENLSFSYPSRKEDTVINDLNLDIKANQLIALVGPSGAGKSTIAALLLRLYNPDEGNLFYDRLKFSEIPLSQLRAQIALVPQDIFLFGGSIKENIGYGKPNATDEEIVEAAKKANCWEFVEKFPEKLDTIVGERGTQLSGGQRQRVAIARAILKDPKILILDEATSSLDSESERLVQNALEVLMQGRTSIVIAHRLSTVRAADQIIVLDQGHLAEKGTHDELMQVESGIYRNLSELQFAEFTSSTK
ncbi:MAG: ATP-binding cassette domain-containing protein [Bacteroidetes bacterium]|jgi:ABC-type multidrug transport system fused ATPase/permease subunit|nr:ATP-binding cassette domain-containing protein [Bacteroidota bacterium]MBT5529948.1 ATP-binding cassette domain-containing protein [Cytophagia bacterium]MBT3422159.1 ATP-binding cassette domain-containing protein [Bacteroidota bacterium]MBT3932647.1 ATP-binding cassette domain-containing protein [Bacteroidota bacterium]MBT4337468.1 ATP-binding cassette domain-containing protein [Bacteroidota bacterium]